MPQWATFVGVTVVILLVLLILSHFTQQALRADGSVSDGPPVRSDYETNSVYDKDGRINDDVSSGNGPPFEHPAITSSRKQTIAPSVDERNDTVSNAAPNVLDELGTHTIYANVLLVQGLFGAILVGTLVFSQIPLTAVGITGGRITGGIMIAMGIGLGILLYITNEIGSSIADWLGYGYSEELRRTLAPETRVGWFVLIVGVLPLIAIFEELLFRGALIGVVAAGYGISPWILAIGSSIVFAFGHGIQGTVGIALTGLLGFVLAVAFIITGSLFLVIVAHYVVNLLEFGIHEGLNIDWMERFE